MRLSGHRCRAVFDCNTLVQAVAFDNGPAAASLRLVESGKVELYLSKATLAELRRVLAYDEVLAISPHMTPTRLGAFVDRLQFRATMIPRVRHVMRYPRDPQDEPYINLAIASKADHLVSWDKDLLSLMTGHSQVCKKFRRLAPGLRVVDPVTFLRLFHDSLGSR